MTPILRPDQGGQCGFPHKREVFLPEPLPVVGKPWAAPDRDDEFRVQTAARKLRSLAESGGSLAEMETVLREMLSAARECTAIAVERHRLGLLPYEGFISPRKAVREEAARRLEHLGVLRVELARLVRSAGQPAAGDPP